MIGRNELEERFPRTCGRHVHSHGRLCMSLCFGDGWNDPVSRLFMRLEALNIVASRFGLSVVVNTVKEKFGTLRVYYEVFNLDGLFRRAMAWPFHAMASVLLNRRKRDMMRRNGILSRIGRVMNHIEVSILYAFRMPDDDRDAMGELLHDIADMFIRQAAKECYDTCEICGRPIHDADDDIKKYGSVDDCPNWKKWSQRVETKGWIRYICRECSEKLESRPGGVAGKLDKEVTS